MAKTYCSNCGEAVDGVAFCAVCGTAVEFVAGGDGSVQTIAPPAPPAAPAFPMKAPLYMPRVGRLSAIKLFFTNYSNFNGRAIRGEFWYPVILLGLLNRVLRNIGSGLAESDGTPSIPFLLLEIAISLALVTPILAAGSRRLHDTGRTAKFLWLLAAPIVGWVILVIFWLGKSEERDNSYGPKPE